MNRSTLIPLLILLISTANKLNAQGSYGLQFNIDNFKTQTLQLDKKSFKVRAYENIVYVSNPIDTAYEVMNIYIPEEYFNGKSINGYTAATAPIFFPNQVGGYMPAKPASALRSGGDFMAMPPGIVPGGAPASSDAKQPMNHGGKQNNFPPPNGFGGMGGERQSAVVMALSKGYIVASAGARGRTTQDKNGIYTGKAPADIVDLKAAIRYLKFNDKAMPGDANKIVSNGTSAGGAMSVLIGATGNNTDYEPYLKTLGAANATDDVFAVSAYCPITNLDHADMAYEWQFNGINSFEARGMPGQNTMSANNTLTPKQIDASNKLKQMFPAYVNSLHLTDTNGNALTLEADGNGSFKDWVKSYVIASAQKALDKGSDLSQHSWITIRNGKVTDIDYNGYIHYMKRMKTPPAFDALDLSTPENQLFGTITIDKQHFTPFSADNSIITAKLADAIIVKMMNPMNYIGTNGTMTAQYWRIRHGTKDKDTGLGIPVILGTYLQNKGYHVNIELPWDRPHSGDYDLDELFAWMDNICK